MPEEFPTLRMSEEELYLHRLRISAQKALLEKGIQSAVNIETYQAEMLRGLITRMSTEILAERVLDTDQKIHWHGKVKRTLPEIPAPRFWWVPFALAGAMAVGGGITRSLETVIASLLVTAYAVLALAANPPTESRQETLPVSGTVTVPATYWRKFPQASIVYPPELRNPVRYQMLGVPYWEEDH